jgi:hypothetical protein
MSERLEVNEQLLEHAREFVRVGVGTSNGFAAREVLAALIGEIERIRRQINGNNK